MPPRKRRARELTPTREQVADDDDVDMEEEKKVPVPKTTSSTEQEKLLQAHHELQLISAAEQPAELCLAEYETPPPYKKPIYVPTIYQMPSRAKLFNY